MEQEKIKQAKEKNRKIYPLYKMFAWDLLFYYPIIFIFLTQIKGLTASNVFLTDAFYCICKIILQPFAQLLINAIGKRRATILGNILVSISILLIILLKGNLINIMITYTIMAMGYLIKGICETFILEESIENGEGKGSKFTKIDSKGSSCYYVFEAISAISTGFLFVINAYIPMYLCLIFCIIGTLISLKFERYETKKEKVEEQYPIRAFKRKIDLIKQEYAFIIKSKRLHSLLLFTVLFSGMLYIRSTTASSILVSIGIHNEYFGVISAAFTIFAAIATSAQHFFHKKLHNKLLTVFSITYSMTYILIGIIAILNLNSTITIVIVLALLPIQNIIKGPYYTLVKRYYNSFSSKEISIRIYSIKALAEDLGAAIVSFLVSILLEHTITSYATLIIGIVSLILFILILDYMKPRIGLKPDEYKKEDIQFTPKLYKEKNVVEIEIGLDKDGKTEIEVH